VCVCVCVCGDMYSECFSFSKFIFLRQQSIEVDNAVVFDWLSRNLDIVNYFYDIEKTQKVDLKINNVGLTDLSNEQDENN